MFSPQERYNHTFSETLRLAVPAANQQQNFSFWLQARPAMGNSQNPQGIACKLPVRRFLQGNERRRSFDAARLRALHEP
jgi:hypothetical protein